MLGHFVCIVIILFLSVAYGQISLIPPYKVFESLDFGISENFIYDSNVAKGNSSQDKNEDSFLFAHSFQMSHSDTRPWYNYIFSYRFDYQSFIDLPERDNTGHNVHFKFIIPRKDATFTFYESFALSSDPRSLEFSAFIRNYFNQIGTSCQMKLAHYISLSANASHEISRYPDHKEWDSEYFRGSGSLGYYFSRQFSLSCGISYQLRWRNVSEQEYNYNYSIPLNVNFNLRDRHHKEADFTEWFRELSISFGYSVSESDFENPINFEISMGGDISKRTTWRLTADRKMEFALISDEVTFSTAVHFTMHHYLNHDWTMSFQFSYERLDYKVLPSLNGIIVGISGQYALTKWLRLQFGYTYTNRFTQRTNENYDSHRISFGTGIYF